MSGDPATERVLATFLELAPLPGPSRAESAVASYVTARLEQAGLVWREDGAAARIGGDTGNLIADLPGSEERRDDPRIVLSAHLDVVPPGRCEAPAVRDGWVVSGSDTVLGADDRAGVAAILEAVDDWASGGASHPPVRLIFCVAEETHLQGSSALDEAALHACALAYVPDSASPLGNLVVETPSCATFEARFRGRPAHAGLAPEKGRSAVQMLARAIDGMRLGRIEEDTTANVGSVEGGDATNVVAATAGLRGECRSFRHERVEDLLAGYEETCRRAAEAFGGTAQWHSEVGFRAYAHERRSPVVDRAWRACERLGIEPRLGRSGGGSDANAFNERGVPAINLGMGTRDNHTCEERIRLEDLVGLYRLLREIVQDG